MNPTPNASLPRILGPWIAMAIVVGTVIGSGVFKKAQVVASNVPEFGLGIAAWVLGGTLALLGALSLAEVAVLFPRAGGNYVFLREGYGRCAGFLWGWVEFWIIRTASIAALATMFTESFHDVLKQMMGTRTEGGIGDVLDFWPRQMITVGVIALLSFINIRGTRLGGGLQLALTIIKVISLVGIAILPFVVLALVPATLHPPKLENLTPTWPADWSQVNWPKFGAAMVGVIWAYHGWMNLGPVAEEIRAPQRNIPIALLGGVLMLIALYVSANVSYYLVLPRDDIVGLKNTTVATEFCFRLLGPIGTLIASAIVMCSVFGSLNGNILVAPRLLFAMGQDRLVPSALQMLHPRFQTPALATIVFGTWSCLMVLGAAALTRNRLPVLNLGEWAFDINLPKDKALFDVVTDFAMFGAISFETLAVASIFVFRHKIPQAERPYRCIGYPVVPALYICFMAAFLGNMFFEQRSEALFGFAFIALGAIVYGLFLRKKAIV